MLAFVEQLFLELPLCSKRIVGITLLDAYFKHVEQRSQRQVVVVLLDATLKGFLQVGFYRSVGAFVHRFVHVVDGGKA